MLIIISQNVSPSWKLCVPVGLWGLLERLKGPDSRSQTPPASLCDLKQITSSLGLLLFRVRVSRGLSALCLGGGVGWGWVNAVSRSESTQTSAEAGVHVSVNGVARRRGRVLLVTSVVFAFPLRVLIQLTECLGGDSVPNRSTELTS